MSQNTAKGGLIWRAGDLGCLDTAQHLPYRRPAVLAAISEHGYRAAIVASNAMVFY